MNFERNRTRLNNLFTNHSSHEMCCGKRLCVFKNRSVESVKQRSVYIVFTFTE